MNLAVIQVLMQIDARRFGQIWSDVIFTGDLDQSEHVQTARLVCVTAGSKIA